MDERFSTKNLLVLRKLTRSVSEMLRVRATQYVSAITPLLRPRLALGEPADAGSREPFQASDKSFKELQSAYESVAGAEPFNLRKDLRPPVEIVSWNIELSPVEYTYAAKPADGGPGKTVTVISPLKWVLSYAGFSQQRVANASYAPRRFRELITSRTRDADELRLFVLHYLTMSLAIAHSEGLGRLMGDLHFKLAAEKLPDFGPLPIPRISSSIATLRPPDDMLIEHTEIAGTDSFEEVVDLQGIVSMRDPAQEKLMELAKSHGAVPAGV